MSNYMIIGPRTSITPNADGGFIVLVDGVQWGPRDVPVTFETPAFAWLMYRDANPDEPNLNDMAQTMVGDGQTPNLYFVTVDGSTLVAYDDLDRAKEYAGYASNDSEFAIMVEDRLNGVVWENAVSLALQLIGEEGENPEGTAVCPHTHGGVHVLNETVSFSSPTSSNKGIVVDVTCRACGRSGSLSIEPGDVTW